jgi:hypothetical protein
MHWTTDVFTNSPKNSRGTIKSRILRSMSVSQRGSNSGLRQLHEVLFSLNLSFAIMYGLIAYTYAGVAPTQPALIFLLPGKHLIVDTSIWLNKFLNLDALSSVGREAVWVALVLATATLIFLAIQLLAWNSLTVPVLRLAGGAAALVAFPAFWLYAFRAAWAGDPALYSFWRSAEWSVFAIEIPAVCAFFVLSRRWSLPMWCQVLVLVIHCFFWTTFLWPSPHMTLWSPKVFVIVFPGAGITWLFYMRRSQQPQR